MRSINKLGASPQLECWNAGILEKWVLEYCNVGLMVEFVLPIKLNRQHPFKNHYSIIPLCHYSMIEAKTQTSNITLYFH